MTTSELAKALLERRSRMTHLIPPGDLVREIGPDSVAEGLRRRWLMPDMDEGFLQVNRDLRVVEEMQKEANAQPQRGPAGPAAIPVSEGHAFSLLHTHRDRSIHEVAAPMTGGASPGLSAVAQPQPPPPPSSQPPTSGSGPPMAVGSQVTVARQGVKSNGVIEKLHPDGRFEVGFPGGQPRPSGGNIYSRDEVSLIPMTPQQAQQPAGTVKATVGAPT
jgi:hypothetical protein